MTARLSQPAQWAVFSILLLLAPITAWGAGFPKNPQTMSECEGPAEEMRALAISEHKRGNQFHHQANAREVSDECAADRRCSAAHYDQLYRLRLAVTKHYGERNRIYKELRELEKTCYATARANEKLAGETGQEEKLADESRQTGAGLLLRTSGNTE